MYPPDWKLRCSPSGSFTTNSLITKVTRSALQNAASIASVILTTESVVADKKDPAADAAAAAAMAGAGGMGGMY